MSSVKSEVAVFYEPDGYKVTGRNVMGRHAAGESFLRAAVAAHKGRDLWTYTSHKASAEMFAKQTQEIDKSVSPRWCPKHRIDLLAKIGLLYYPGPDIAPLAKLRLRQGIDAFSLRGITHTTASHRAMDALSTTLQAPLMPWDAIICTSSAVLDTVRVQREAEEEYLRWRLGAGTVLPEGPQFPVIPLGIHVSDFKTTEALRAGARSEMGFGADEVVVLFVGRLSFHAKAHPDAMHLAVEAASRGGTRKIVLLQCGWFENDAIRDSFQAAAAGSAPNVRAVFVDGREAAVRRQSWAAADIFISLADNIQETFGLTPVEAMAAGLPVLVTDWNGYKDTVRDGIDGFRITTTMPPPGSGRTLAHQYEADAIGYDRYCGYACNLVSIDHRQLAEKLTLLVEDAELRRTMGRSARVRARDVYDWSVVFRTYQELWRDLAHVRLAATRKPEFSGIICTAPRQAPGRSDPTKSFEHYATRRIEPRTIIARAGRVDGLTFETLREHPLFAFAKPVLPDVGLVRAMYDAIQTPQSIESLSIQLGNSIDELTRATAILAKMGLLCFESLDP